MKSIKILTLDTETIGLHGSIKRIAVYDGLKVHYGYGFSDILNVLESYYDAGFDVHIYVHNLEFDIRKIDIFERGIVNWNKSVIINGHYVRICCDKYTFHDSYRIIPGKLSKITKDFQLEHSKLDLYTEVKKKYKDKYKDEVDFLTKCHKDNELYLKYLGYDVISLWELIFKLIDISGISQEKFVRILTTASLSKYLFKNGYKGHIFRHRKRKTDYEILTDNKKYSGNKSLMYDFSEKGFTYSDIERIIREGYFGGRTEVFKPYTGTPVNGYLAKHYDFNSLYPYEMHEHIYPYGEPEYYENNAQNIFEKWLKYKEGLGFVKCTVNVPKQHIPPLPVKKDKLVFLTGILKGVWTYVELEYAIKYCGVEIVEYESVIHFQKTAPYFKDFVKTLYELKENAGSNKALRTFAKLILNCAYGWTGLNRDDKTQLVPYCDKEKYSDKIVSFNKKIGFCEIKSDIKSESVQVQAAAYVTSYARLDLIRLLHSCDKKGVVYYCDTDSIVTDVEIDSTLIHPTKLGYLDLEKLVYEGIFIQPKLYYEIGLEISGDVQEFSITKKHKGVRKIEVKRPKNIFIKDINLWNEKFIENVYRELLYLLIQGNNEKYIVERDRETLRSVLCTQKENIDINSYRLTDKGFNLGNVQKRNIDYESNVSYPWHCSTLEDFNALSFVRRFPYEKYGAVINPISKSRKNARIKV